MLTQQAGQFEVKENTDMFKTLDSDQLQMQSIPIERNTADWVSPQVKEREDFIKYYNNTFVYVSLRTDSGEIDAQHTR